MAHDLQSCLVYFPGRYFLFLFYFDFYILFLIFWVAGTYVNSVALHTHQINLWNCILPTPMSGIKPVRTYSNVNFVTDHTLQKIVWIIISMPNIGRNEMLSKSVVVFDRDSNYLLFPISISIWTFLSLFYFDFYFILFLIFWMEGTNVSLVVVHTLPKILWEPISVPTIGWEAKKNSGINVDFVTDHTY